MEDILRDLSTERLIVAIEENLSSWMPLFSLVGEVRLNDPAGVKRAISQLPVALFNSIMDAQLDEGNVDATIEMVKSDAIARQAPILWWVGPSTHPIDLGDRLLKCGFGIEDDGPGMAVNLESINENQQRTEGLSIIEAQGDEALTEWSKTMFIGFEAPETRMSSLVEAWSRFLNLVDPTTTQAYLARLNGKTVATSLLRLGGGVAGIYAVATVPEARRKGIGAQVTLAPLLYARSLGYRAGILQSSEMGFNVYRSLGFEVHCRICSYSYRPKPI